MTSKAVIGLGFGDEGKGITTEYFCSQSPEDTIVVRFSGGQQAGHKVIRGDVEHIFSNFGAGTLSGCPTFWSEHCTFDPVGFINEYQALRDKGVSPRIYVHPDCAVTTVYDILANRQGVEVKHGTTGTGFFKTKKRHFTDGVQLTVFDALLATWDELAAKLKEIQKYYNVKEDLSVGAFLSAVLDLRRVKGAMFAAKDVPTHYKHRVFEGSQGLLLDEHIGYMPHCTPSDLTPRNILRYDLDEVCLVTRAYQTRHGNGPMTNAHLPVRPFNNEKETNVCNRYQGEFRTTVLDMDQLVHAKTKGIDKVIKTGTKVSLMVTCLDQVDEYKVTSGNKLYTFNDYMDFVKFAGKVLNITGNLYTNDSPCANTIRNHEGTNHK
jgi:adenylosuccinate synthase